MTAQTKTIISSVLAADTTITPEVREQVLAAMDGSKAGLKVPTTTRLLTKAAAARALGCSRPTIYDILAKHRGIFQKRTDGKVRECDLQAYMAGRAA